jgi:hypothetical protein
MNYKIKSKILDSFLNPQESRVHIGLPPKNPKVGDIYSTASDYNLYIFDGKQWKKIS